MAAGSLNGSLTNSRSHLTSASGAQYGRPLETFAARSWNGEQVLSHGHPSHHGVSRWRGRDSPVTAQTLLPVPGSDLASGDLAVQDVSTAVEVLPELDTDLIARVRLGDSGALETLWIRHHGVVRACAIRYSFGRDADDLVSEAFTRIIEMLRRNDGSGPNVNFCAYWCTSARNLAHRRGRDATVAFTTLDLEPEWIVSDFNLLESDPAEAVMAREVMDVAREVWDGLPDRWKEALWLADQQGMASAAIGDRLGLSANAAAALVYRGRRALRDGVAARTAVA